MLSDLMAAYPPIDTMSDDEIRREIVSIVQFLLAGHETTTSTIASGLCQLLLRDGRSRAVRGRPREPFRGRSRRCCASRAPCSTSSGGWLFRTRLAGPGAGEGSAMLKVILGSANHDERQFEDPEGVRDRATAEPAPGVRAGHPSLPRRPARAHRGSRSRWKRCSGAFHRNATGRRPERDQVAAEFHVPRPWRSFRSAWRERAATDAERRRSGTRRRPGGCGRRPSQTHPRRGRSRGRRPRRAAPPPIGVRAMMNSLCQLFCESFARTSGVSKSDGAIALTRTPRSIHSSATGCGSSGRRALALPGGPSYAGRRSRRRSRQC